MITEGWQKIGAAALVAKEDLIAEAYAEEYKHRYGVAPSWSFDGSDMTVVKDLVRKVGDTKARQLLRAFVRMNDPWFIERGHSLECFKKNIPRINAFLGTKLEQAVENRSVVIATRLTCDRCFIDYLWQGKPQDIDKPRLCEGCK